MNNIDDIEALKKKSSNKKISVEKNEKLRKKVEKIILRNEAETRSKKIEELEHIYELGMYA